MKKPSNRKERIENMTINLNDAIKVKLTPKGVDIFYHRFDELNMRYGHEVYKAKLPQIDEHGFTEFQLWDFMKLYGAHMQLGMDLPCDTDIVVVN